jgi:hypothetical protein
MIRAIPVKKYKLFLVSAVFHPVFVKNFIISFAFFLLVKFLHVSLVAVPVVISA